MTIENSQPNALRAASEDLTVYYFNLVPCPAPRMVQSDKWKKRPCVVRYFTFRDELQRQANQQGFTLCNGLTYIFLLPMPDSWSKKKKDAMRHQLHEQTPDIDNLQKSLMDGMLSQDKAIAHIQNIFKLWSDSGQIIIIKPWNEWTNGSLELIQDLIKNPKDYNIFDNRKR